MNVPSAHQKRAVQPLSVRKTAISILLTALACSATACESPQHQAAPDCDADAGAAAVAVTQPAAGRSAKTDCSVTVVVTTGDGPIRDVQFGITTRDGQFCRRFTSGSETPAAPLLLPPGRYWILAGRMYPVAPETTWEFSGVKELTLKKSDERATVEFAVPRMETIPFRVEPPRDSGVAADFFEYVEVELDQPKQNSIFTEFQADSFEVRSRVPVGKTVPLPVLPPGQYTVYVEYAVKRSLGTRATSGPGEWTIPSVASLGDTITFPFKDGTVVVRPSLNEEDQGTLRALAER